MLLPYGVEGDGIFLLLLLGVMVLGYIAQASVQSTFNKYAQAPSSARMSADNVAKNLLSRNGSYVTVTPVQGTLTDHFNPKTGVVGLSQSVYGSSSVAAVAVAAHEVGHVMQYENGYFPIRVRNAILPVASFGSQAAPWMVLIGLFFASERLALVGIILFCAAFLFQIITLPVEFDASSRAIRMLEEGGFISYDDRSGAKKVLRAAAMTYVVAALASLVTLLRYINLLNRGRRR